MEKLTIKQKKFADEYIISGNATDAAKKAGYSEKTAYSIGNENLTKPVIKDYIEARMKKHEENLIASQDEILRYLTSLIRGEQTEQTLIMNGEYGQDIADIEVSAKDRIRAAELLGKRWGTWTDKVDITADLAVTFVDDVPETD